MSTYLKFTFLAIAAGFLVGCAQGPVPRLVSVVTGLHMQRVRTTAYTHSERGGRHNAIGKHLSGRHVMSAASDWSRFPLGTRFRVITTNQEYIIDDYGTALVGTNTIDLYQPTRLEMRRWGVRHVDIDVLEWGSEEESLKVLAPRAKHRCVRQMIARLEQKKAQPKKKV